MKRVFLILVCAFSLGAQWTAGAQERLNEIYRYPFSLGISYVPLSPVSGVLNDSAATDIAIRFRMPLAGTPELTPMAALSLTSYDSVEAAAPIILGGTLDAGATMPEYIESETWDHRNFSLSAGLGYEKRISAEFEAGGEALIGLEYSAFPRRVVDSSGDWYPVGEAGLIVDLRGKASLNPSYNLSIDILPSFRYARSLGALHDFDGLYFGLGFGVHYRFGDDPAQSTVRAIRFSDTGTPAVFASMQKIYAETPFATISIENSERYDLRDIEVSFFQAGYMDGPTLCAEIDLLESGSSAEIPIRALFNERVFQTVDSVPLNGELRVSYEYRGRVVEQTRSIGYELFDRNTLVWNDDRKVAAFITPRDSAVRNYASYAADRSRESNTDYLPDNLEKAIQLYYALAALNIGYQADPVSPFAQVQGSEVFLDSVSLPRETLVRGTGDCDDLTVLYNTMLESVSVPTGFVTIPGHIYSAVDTGMSAREYGRIHPDRDMVLVHNETAWVLVEITLLGKQGFLDAWQTGINQWNATDPLARTLHVTGESQETYAPVGLQESDLGLQYADAADISEAFRRDRDRLGALILGELRSRVQQRDSARGWNLYGATAAMLGDFTESEAALKRSLELEPSGIATLINLGLLYREKNRLDLAEQYLRRAVALLGGESGSGADLADRAYRSLSVVLTDRGADDEARRVAEMITPSPAGGGGESAGRAAEGGEDEPLFVLDFMGI
jgi:tetratricopeptide (TPR) repeat protein